MAVGLNSARRLGESWGSRRTSFVNSQERIQLCHESDINFVLWNGSIPLEDGNGFCTHCQWLCSIYSEMHLTPSDQPRYEKCFQQSAMDFRQLYFEKGQHKTWALKACSV